MNYWLKETKYALRMWWKTRKQTTWCWCPVCKNELCATDSFIKDTDFVYFECSRCKTKSKWDFDLPCPFLIDWKLSRKSMKQTKLNQLKET